MILKAVIFDMDDTLIDWGTGEQDWLDFEYRQLPGVYDYVSTTVDRALPDYDVFVQTHYKRVMDAWQEAARTLEAPHLGHVLLGTLEQLGVPTGQLDMNTCLRAYNWDGLPGAAPFPEVPEVLAHLRAQGVQLGIITNAFHPMWMRDRELQGHGLSPDWFACRISTADVGYLKPHPATFEKIMATLGITADEGVFIGDTPGADIVGAQGVGMKAVLRVRDEVPPKDTGDIVPDAIISSLQDLLPVFDGWYPGWQ